MSSPTYPPYAFVPGHWPHPTRDPDGHSYGKAEPKAQPLNFDAWQECTGYLHGVNLFNAGYYWEAHEAWENVWNALGREGLEADLLKGLIKLAAVGIKIRQNYQEAGQSLARQAGRHLQDIRTKRNEALCAGLNLDEIILWCEELGKPSQKYQGDPSKKVEIVFANRLAPVGLNS